MIKRRSLFVLVVAASIVAMCLPTPSVAATEQGLYCNALAPSEECTRQALAQAQNPPSNSDAAAGCAISEAHIEEWSRVVGVKVSMRGYGSGYCTAASTFSVMVHVNPRPDLTGGELIPGVELQVGVPIAAFGIWGCQNTVWCGATTNDADGFGFKACWDGDVYLADASGAQTHTQHIYSKCVYPLGNP